VRRALALHWPEYTLEAAGLGLFMVSASLAAVALFHPASPVVPAVPEPFWRRALMGLAMGLTAIALVYSPLGQRSGAHFNPAVTLAFWRLGRVSGWDALFYVASQLMGGVAGVLAVATATGDLLADPAVAYVVTVPGARGAGVAFGAEVVISLVLMAVVLAASSTPALAPFTGLCAGALVATWILVEAPLSGMSMNPARTLASALPANVWTAFWIYLTAPPLGMLLAAELHARLRRNPVRCAKLHHTNTHRCIFRCGYAS